MKIDLNGHREYSHDNYVDPEDLIEEAVSKGLDGMAFREFKNSVFNINQPFAEMKNGRRKAVISE